MVAGTVLEPKVQSYLLINCSPVVVVIIATQSVVVSCGHSWSGIAHLIAVPLSVEWFLLVIS